MSESYENTGDGGSPANDLPTMSAAPQLPDEPTQASIQQTQQQTQQAKPKKSRKRRGIRILISLLLVLIILAACGLGGYRYAVDQYNQLYDLGAQMCNNLEAHKYDTLYQHFSDNLKSNFTEAEFSHFGAEIDQFEGSALSCGQADGNKFSVDVGQHTITVASLVNREGSGAHYGHVRFLFTGNSWKVDSFDVGFLGVSLDALRALDNFCGALMARDYRSFYLLLAPALRSEAQQQYVQDAALQQLIDGITLQCALKSFGKVNTETNAVFSVYIRHVVYENTGNVTFEKTSSGWTLTSMDPVLPGRDIAPVTVVTRWCSDIKSQNYSDAFALLSSNARQGNSAKALAAQYSGKAGGDKWLDCAADPTTYQGVTNVSLVVRVHDSSPQHVDGAEFHLVQEEKQWKIDTIFMCGNTTCAG